MKQINCPFSLQITRGTAICFHLLILTFSTLLYSCTDGPDHHTLSLNGPWNFFVDSSLTGYQENLDSNGIPYELSRIVMVPHTWNVDKGLEKYWGVCWYEKKIEIEKDQLSKIARLQFDGVYHDAFIYINGQLAGEHIGSGYNRFFINITPFLKKGENTIIVRVDNSPSQHNIPFLKSYDWANDGGIYRNASLIFTEPESIDNIHVTAVPEGKKGIANVSIGFIDTSAIRISKLKLTATITEENQNTHNQIFKGDLKGQYENGRYNCKLVFDSIHPWHFDSPDLYKLSVKLFSDGYSKDSFAVVFGFRSIKIENNRYVLNGEPMRLMGVEWMPGSHLERGMAETTEDLQKNLELMKNANCIFTRFHWQQDEFVFDWCDRNGILVQEEIPYWGGVTNLTKNLTDLGIVHLDEMIGNHFNHPSIIAWGIGNELASHEPGNIEALNVLYNHAKNIDSSRLVTYVSNNLQLSIAGKKPPLPDATANFDMMMFNEYYSTWYGQTIEAVSPELDRISSEYPMKPITISEWGICEPAHKGGDERRSHEMIQQHAIYSSKDYIAGAIYFCLNDYRTHMGEDFTYSYPQRVHGVCDIRLNPKQSYDTLKFISSPIMVDSVLIDTINVNIFLTGKTGLPSYVVRNYTLETGGQKININELKPGEQKKMSINTDASEFRILRPNGYEVSKLKFR